MICFSHQDCSSNFHHFEKYHDLPTRGAGAVEQFSINGNLFLAFASARINTDGINTDSFIYKLKDSTGKLSLFETIGTFGARDMECFTISYGHYLAVAYHYNGTTYASTELSYLSVEWTRVRLLSKYFNKRGNEL